jgi:hypothetical protein
MIEQGRVIEQLRDKWREVPATRHERQFSADLLRLPDRDLLRYWNECRRQTSTPEVRGWYQELYKDRLRGARVADVGPGVGVDGIWFAEHGAHVTFADIVVENLALLRRLCELKGINAQYYYIDDFFEYTFPDLFDCFLCVGSLINAPFDFTARQVAALMKHLHVGGTVLMLGYPKARFDALGARDGAEFGKMTDGPRTPWAEWYDEQKIGALFGPAFRLELTRNLGRDEIEFNWFELTKLT